MSMKKKWLLIIAVLTATLGFTSFLIVNGNHQKKDTKETKISSSTGSQAVSHSQESSTTSSDESKQNSATTNQENSEQQSSSSSNSQSSSKTPLINSGEQAEQYIKNQLGYLENNDITSGSTQANDAAGTYYVVQLKRLIAVTQNGGGGTIGYYKVYSSGNWSQLP